MLNNSFKPKKRDVVQYILVLTVIAIILAYAFPKIRDKMGIANKDTMGNLEVGMGNMFSNSPATEDTDGQCSVTLSSVDVDIPLATRQSYIDSYTYEYAIDSYIDEFSNVKKTYRTYIYSNTPLTLSIKMNPASIEPYGQYSEELQEATNQRYSGFNIWRIQEIMYDYHWETIPTSPMFFTNSSLNKLVGDWDSEITTIHQIRGC